VQRLGVARRNPDIKWLRRADDLAGFAWQQAAMLDALWPLLAVGGTMLYATCSIFPEENEAQVQAFLTRHNQAAGRAVVECPGHAVAAALPRPPGAAKILPDATHDGFFYALLRKC
jgi:tRNA and rRNA cytosine-C5-methylases